MSRHARRKRGAVKAMTVPARFRPVVARQAATFWGPHAREAVAEALRTLPPRAAGHRVHLLLHDELRHALCWAGTLETPPEGAETIVEGCSPRIAEGSLADLAERIPTLAPSLHAAFASDLAAGRCFPLRHRATLVGLLLVAPPSGGRFSARLASDLRRHARLTATVLMLARRSLEEQRELEGYRALSHLLDAGAPRDRQALARALGKSMAAVTRARTCLILARADASAPLVAIGSRGYPSHKASSLVLWPQESPWTEILTEEHPFEIDTAHLDRATQEVLGDGRVLIVPIHWKGWLRSLLILPADVSQSGAAQLLDPARLSSVAAHAGLLWQNAELIQRLRRDEEVLQGLTQRAVQVQEEERRRIASDIHDGVTQRIISIWYRVLNLEKVMVRSLDEAREELATIKTQLDAALQEARGAIYNLRPSTLDDLGLVPSLRSLVHEFEKETGVACLMQVRGDRRLPGYVEVGIYRIAQEALRNVKKHAQATSAKLSLHLGEETVRLTVSDDGRGFARKRRSAEALLKSFGLESMAERAQMLGADLFVRSHPGEGTTLRVALGVPLENVP